MEPEEDVQNSLMWGAECCIPLFAAIIRGSCPGPGPGPSFFEGEEERERGVASSCLTHFLPSTPALIGNLGGRVYLHG